MLHTKTHSAGLGATETFILFALFDPLWLLLVLKLEEYRKFINTDHLENASSVPQKIEPGFLVAFTCSSHYCLM